LKTTRYELAGLRCVEVAPDDAATRSDLPLVVTLHGLGDWGESFVDFAPIISQTAYRFVFPNAPLPLPGARFQWFRFQPSNFFGGVSQARHHIEGLLAALSARYHTPANRIVLSGFSQGAMLTLETGLHYRDTTGKRLAGLIALSGMLVVESARTPNFMSPDFKGYYASASSATTKILTEAAADSLPILVAHGKRDTVVPLDAGRETVALLQKAGLPVEYTEFNYGHEISIETVNLIRQFLGKVLK